MSMIQAVSGPGARRRFWFGVAAYVLPSFPIAIVWHLIFFAQIYHSLGVYRDDMIMPFGMASMLIQGAAFSYAYPRLMAERAGGVFRNGLVYGAALAALSWSFTTLAVAAKNVMASPAAYLLLETGFTVVQFAVVGPLMALAHKR